MVKEKILLFTLEFPPQKGGVSKYYENLAKHWPDGDFAILADDKENKENSSSVKRKSFLYKYLRPRWIPSLFRLYQSVKEFKKQGFRVHVIVGQILPLGLPAFYLSTKLGFTYSVVLHGLDFSLSLHKKNTSRKILLKAEKIICANSYTASQVKHFDSSLINKVFVVNPGIESRLVRNPAKVLELKNKYCLEGKQVIFSMGRLVKRKGFDRAIKSMTKVADQNNKAVLVIGGTGEEEENLESLRENLGVEIKNKIIFTGKLSDEDYWAWLELCDIFIMTSRNINGDYEGFGIVYLEANLAGKAVVAGDSGGVRDAVFNNVNGLLVDPENETLIAEAILKLLSNNILRNDLGSAGNRRVVETMSAKKQAEKFYKTLKEKI